MSYFYFGAQDYTEIESTEHTSRLEASCTRTADAEVQRESGEHNQNHKSITTTLSGVLTC